MCIRDSNNMNASELNHSNFRLLVPCGLIQGSSITIIGLPNGLLGNFRIDLTGEQIPGEPEPPIILHYNVRLHGDKITDDPVIVQNSWTVAHDWGEEKRCPSPEPDINNKGIMLLSLCAVTEQISGHTALIPEQLGLSLSPPPSLSRSPALSPFWI